MAAAPRVSVVIPTFERPDLVQRAVRSALAQTVADIEVIVVVDGRDPATMDALRAIDDPRLRVHVPDRHLGNAEARNAGVRLARAPWVAFLDDDDTWLPDKLASQLPVAERAAHPHPVVGCRFIARNEAGDVVWPRRPPRPGEDWSEYFFCRRTPFTGEGMVITSTILAGRDLLLAVPFTSGLERHVDPDWLLRAARHPGVALEIAPGVEPLAVWHIEDRRHRITTARDWRASLEWCRANRMLFTDRAYAAFVLHVVGYAAARQGAWVAFPLLLREAVGNGRPALVDLASHAANFLLPAGLQRRVAAVYGRRRALARNGTSAGSRAA
jgi:glycosyltransferase involved in cell wall biosynthesis